MEYASNHGLKFNACCKNTLVKIVYCLTLNFFNTCLGLISFLFQGCYFGVGGGKFSETAKGDGAGISSAGL